MKTPRRPGFTLIELLVTIGIITILLAILIPVVGRVRLSAQTAATQALIQKISTAINNYRNDFNDYPGLVPNSAYPGGAGSYVNGAGALTQTEDMTLCLMGGYSFLNLNPPSGVKLDVASSFGQGPVVLNPIRPEKRAPYLERRGDELPTKIPGSLAAQGGDMPQFGYCADSDAPEFMDQYSMTDRRPILYIRANRGAKPGNSVSTSYNRDYSYNLGSVLMYLKNPQNTSTATLQDFQTTVQGSAWSGGSLNTSHVLVKGWFVGSDGVSAKFPDSYLLIGAGPDHLFGTPDDIIYGGGGGGGQ